MDRQAYLVDGQQSRSLVLGRPGDEACAKALTRCLGEYEGVPIDDYEPPKDGFYRSTGSFLRTHGRYYLRPWASSPRKGLQNVGILNAISFSLAYGYRYVEGQALVKPTWPKNSRYFGCFWTWNVDEYGRPIDWNNGPLPLALCGVEFSVDRAYDAWSYRYPGISQVIEDGARGWPLLRSPWLGEDYNKRFACSAELDHLRGRPLAQVRRFLKARQRELKAAEEMRRAQLFRSQGQSRMSKSGSLRIELQGDVTEDQRNGRRESI